MFRMVKNFLHFIILPYVITDFGLPCVLNRATSASAGMVEYKRGVRTPDLRKCLVLIDTTCLSISELC